MRQQNIPGLQEFLVNNPGLKIVPSRSSHTSLKGRFDIDAQAEGFQSVKDSYQLEFVIPENFPTHLPRVKETDGKIPKDGVHHVNSGDGTLCLGSPLRLRFLICENRNLTTFVDKCLVPYLYAISHKLQFGGELPWGELDHGEPGIVLDYMELLGLESKEQVYATLEILGKRKRVANKKPCPCGCGQRLGKCKFRWKVLLFRRVASRKWFRQSSLADNH